MFYRVRQLQYTARPERPDPLYARKLQEVLGGQWGDMSVTMTYLLQRWNCRGPAKYRDMDSIMKKNLARRILAAAITAALAAACGGGNTGPGDNQTAPGAERSAKTAALETGASALQAKAPVDQIAMYLVGFHPSKADPHMQMESHHYCDQVNQDFAQCVLYDGNTESARLHGVEYIISEKLYETLPDEERPYWHPHNFEILSGELRMPGLPDAAENEALKTKINSYGKTWHFWKTGVFGAENDALPLGAPHLAWSFNRDGEMNRKLLEARDTRMGLDTAAARRQRADWASLARPQAGVNAIADKFPGAGGAPPGVRDNGDTRVKGVPVLSIAPR